MTVANDGFIIWSSSASASELVICHLRKVLYCAALRRSHLPGESTCPVCSRILATSSWDVVFLSDVSKMFSLPLPGHECILAFLPACAARIAADWMGVRGARPACTVGSTILSSYRAAAIAAYTAAGMGGAPLTAVSRRPSILRSCPCAAISMIRRSKMCTELVHTVLRSTVDGRLYGGGPKPPPLIRQSACDRPSVVSCVENIVKLHAGCPSAIRHPPCAGWALTTKTWSAPAAARRFWLSNDGWSFAAIRHSALRGDSWPV